MVPCPGVKPLRARVELPERSPSGVSDHDIVCVDQLITGIVHPGPPIPIASRHECLVEEPDSVKHRFSREHGRCRSEPQLLYETTLLEADDDIGQLDSVRILGIISQHIDATADQPDDRIPHQVTHTPLDPGARRHTIGVGEGDNLPACVPDPTVSC